jgi:hypothetical protein
MEMLTSYMPQLKKNDKVLEQVYSFFKSRAAERLEAQERTTQLNDELSTSNSPNTRVISNPHSSIADATNKGSELLSEKEQAEAQPCSSRQTYP